MTISRRLGVGYGSIAAACLMLVIWLGYHEFVEEPAQFRAAGMPNLHQDTQAELSTVCFLGAIPALLGLGWWWVRRVLAPLGTLASAVERIDSTNLQQPLPRSHSGDEVDKLAAAFNLMTSRLDQSFRQTHEFTLHASHELKTPLTVMRAQLDTVLREAGSAPNEQDAWIRSQLEELSRMSRIVDSLTLLTKADVGLVTLERQSVPLDELIEASFEDAQILAAASQILVTLGPLVQTTIIGDRQRLRQLLLILLDNAVKYNSPGGRIVISLRASGSQVELEVTNTSDAIAPKTLERIFERFVRGENAQGKVDGCGLGLTIARWIVQSHGGNIQLVAETEGLISARIQLPKAGSIGSSQRP